jgi:hypothetical protein
LRIWTVSPEAFRDNKTAVLIIPTPLFLTGELFYRCKGQEEEI